MRPGAPFSTGRCLAIKASSGARCTKQLVDTLADLHVIDVAASGLSDFGKPGNYFERQVKRWTRQYRDSQTDELPAMEKLIEFLPRTLPGQQRVSVVHGDYRIDNVLFEDGELTAVLDWELATLGDPLADFSYLAMQWHMPADGLGAGLAGLDLQALGIPPLDEVVERYSARSGVAVEGRLDWYFAYNLFRLAGIVQGIKKRVIDGTASNAKAAEMARKVPMLADTAWQFAVKAGA